MTEHRRALLWLRDGLPKIKKGSRKRCVGFYPIKPAQNINQTLEAARNRAVFFMEIFSKDNKHGSMWLKQKSY